MDGQNDTLLGLYTGQRTDLVFVPNVFGAGGGSYQYRTRTFYYLFLPGSKVYNGLPTGGHLLDFNCEGSGDEACGTYTIDGDQVQIQLASGNTVTLTLIDSHTLQLGNLTLQHVDGGGDDLVLDGTYAYSTFVDTTGAGGEGGVSGQHSITFSPDGTFSASNFTGISVSGPDAVGSDSGSSSISGTYAIGSYTLTLTTGDGNTAPFTFFQLPGNDGTPGAISIDGTQYLAQG